MRFIENIKLSKFQLILVGILLTSLYMLPYIVLGQDMYVCDHDFLDSHQAYLKVLKDNSIFWDAFGLFPAMEGVRLSGFDSLYPLRLLIYTLFEPYTAFVIGDWIARIIGFLGMFLLLNYYSKNEYRHQIIALACSVMFGLLWFHDGYFELGSAGYPLLLYNFLCLRMRRYVALNMLSLILIASFSSIFHLSFFACIIMFIYFVYLYCKEQKVNTTLFWGIIVLGISSLAFSSNTLLNFFFSDEVSHRVEFNGGLPLLSCVKGTISLLLKTQEHTGVFVSVPVIFTLVYALCFKQLCCKCRVYKTFTIIIAIVIFWGVYQYLKYLLPDFRFIQKFQADRFYFILPTLWIALVYFVLVELKQSTLNKTVTAFVVFASVCGAFYANPEYSSLITKIRIGYTSSPTYKQFFDTALFNAIKKDVPVGSKVCSVGMYPSILSYNGYHTMDGYFVSYPLQYKYTFRHVIKKELDKSEELKNYYDNWGSRCYLFSSELGKNYLFGKNSNIEIENFEIDIYQLKEIGCQYIFSAVPILNYPDLNIKLINQYSNNDSFWNIYVFKL